MAYQSLPRGLPVSAHPVLLHIRKYRFQNLPVLRRPKKAIGVGNDIMGSARVKSCNQIPIPVISDGKLGLIAVMPWLFHTRYVLHHHIDPFCGKAADTHKVFTHLILFPDKLSLILHSLNLTASALSVKSAFRRHTKRRRCHHLLYSGITVIFPAFGNLRLYCIADNRILYKQSISVGPADTFAVVSDVLYVDRYYIVLFITRKFHSQSTQFWLLPASLL